jgi:hypothetical protein
MTNFNFNGSLFVLQHWEHVCPFLARNKVRSVIAITTASLDLSVLNPERAGHANLLFLATRDWVSHYFLAAKKDEF